MRKAPFTIGAMTISCLAFGTPVLSAGAEDSAVSSNSIPLPALRQQTEGEKPWAFFQRFAPEKKDYNLELGSMWEQNSMYWIAGNVGVHLGRCILSNSQTCQQYFEFVGGASGRDGITEGLILLGPRWQFVNFPEVVSPSVALLGGIMNFRGRGRDRAVGTYALEYGFSIAVHDNLDLKLTGRVGMTDQVWGQSFISLSFKMNRIVEYFAEKMKALGVGTIETTGSLIKGTIEGTGKIIKGAAEGTGKVIKGTIEGASNLLKSDKDKASEPEKGATPKESGH